LADVPGLPPGVTGATSLPSNIPNIVTLRKNVQVSSCAAVAGGWAATGTATDPGAAAAEYTITVFFTTTGATVIDAAQTKVSLTAGQSRTWKISEQFHAAPTMLCVLRGVG
jgi:hypothetical protein